MRTKKIAIGALAEIIPYFIIGILGIIKVRVFIMYLGDILNGYYQFINSAITYIFMAEAGFGAAVAFSLYKYFAHDDFEGVKKVYAGSRKIFKFFGYIILGLTVATTILIPLFFIKHEAFSLDVTLTFLIIAIAYLISFFSSGQSYLAIFSSDQKKYVYSIIFNSLRIIGDLLVILLVVYTKSLIVVAVVILLIKIVEQFIMSYYGRKHYPYLEKNYEADTSMFGMTKDLAWHQLGYVAANNIDSVILLLVNGPFVVSIYTSYNFILRFLREIAAKIDGVIVHSFGNVFAKEEIKRSYKLFIEYSSMCVILAFCFSTTFLIGIRSFVQIWIGDITYMLPYKIIVLFALNLFLMIIYLPLVSAISSNGLYKESKNYILFTSFVNIVLSILFVLYFGIAGVLMATSIAMAITIILRSKIIKEYVFTDINLTEFANKYFVHISLFLLIAYLFSFVEKYVLGITNIFYLITILGVVFIISLIIVTLVMLIFDKNIIQTIKRIKGLIRKRAH